MLCVLILAVAAGSTAAQALTYWCPMHPDERAASAIACPVCKMTMVRIPPMRVGEYRMDIAPIAASAGQGLAGIRVTLRDPVRRAAVTALEMVHEKPVHVFIVGRDLEFFRHLHPDSVRGGAVELRTAIPPGEYMVIADFLPTGGTPQVILRALIVPGTPKREAGEKSGIGNPVAGVRVQPARTDLTAGEEATVRIALTGITDDRPILDLQPYLGAAAHLLLVSEDLTEAVHGHPAEWTAAEPVLAFELTLPRAGRYRGWLQFQRQGVVVTAPIVLTAR